MDTLPIATRWPRYPYRGLDFYRGSDARLFRERDVEIQECSDIVLGFGVKILLLQGSSGSGKSSFLRAGLIPRLKESQRRNFFLSGRDSVIRCTGDPLPEIARALIGTLGNGDSSAATANFETAWGAEALVEPAVSEKVWRTVEPAIAGPREQLADVLVSSFVEVCADLPGKLILVLDQAEEVLTRTKGGHAKDEASAAFFRFLEDIYLRNVDTRVVVALRTEYYGWFRDELRISDDRLSKRPRSGGIEPYLLRPIRDKSALSHVIEAPSSARREDGISVYNFEFEQGLTERIVDDLLDTFRHAAVTPALQVVCSSLYARLTEKNRTITHTDYTRLGRFIGIFDDYLKRGISAAGARTKAQFDLWGELLHSLVSRQGGGTLVSLIEPLEELEKGAQDLGIRGAIEPALVSLTRGAAPLLRGEPPDDPRSFSLKHDVLAIVLARWYAEHNGAIKAKKQAKRLFFGIAIAALVIGLFLGSIIWQRGEEAFRARARSIDLTNRNAIHAPEGNFRRSLLLTLANLDATQRPGDFHEWMTGDDRQIHGESLAEFREVLSRAPWFAGRYRAAGLDPAGNQIALLTQDEQSLLVLTLPADDQETAEPKTKSYELPDQPAQTSALRPAAGFITDLGPAALVDGYVYYWNERDERGECNIGPSLPVSGSWMRAEFVAGGLQISVTERHDLKSSLRVLRLGASQLRACAAISAAEALQIPERPFSRPVPVFSEAPDLPRSYGYLEESSKAVPNELGANLPVDPSRLGPGKPIELDAVVSIPEQEGRLVHIAVGQISPERGVPERLHYTIASAANSEAMLFKFDGPDFYVYDLAKGRVSSRLGYLDVTPQHVAVASNLPLDAWRLQPARIPWVYPPFAAAQIGQHWRAAWLAANGVWAVESNDRDPGTARPVVDAPLMGEPDGAKLQFTADGQFLVLQRVQLQLPMSVRIWDLRPSWRRWIENPETTEEELRKVACRIVRMDGTGGAFDETETELFQIDAAHREPCPAR
ncbi:MAG TPA: hypothetical protein VNZ53_16105 [Steroidobacteraceae bacterium]|nr:hypothetical protein [Steroidobacteraceae bacterium]